ncbi:MAG: type II secretion system F family protein [Actinobacteria bacterium]|nr:type II secretion system F family protein [Actinomycetota bacterium]
MIAPLALLAAAGVWAGLSLLLRGLRPPPPPLAEALAAGEWHPHEPGSPVPERGWVARVGAAAARAAWLPRSAQADLAVLSRSRDRHAAEQVLAACCFASFVPLTAVALAAFGVGLPAGLVALVAVAFGAGGLAVPGLVVRTEATKARDELRHGLCAFADLVVIVLAGGGGIETALADASRAGEGPAFTQIESALGAARVKGTPPWDALSALGERLGVGELGELGANLALAGTHGARVRQALAASAASLRARRIARVEAKASSATEAMNVPVAGMLFGFLAFLLYPSLLAVLGM